MKGLFNYDGPVMGFLGRLVDLCFLNVLVMFFSIPIVTMGAAITAGHYTSLKLHRGDTGLSRLFWRSFKENFKQSTVIWIGFLVLIFGSLLVILAGGFNHTTMSAAAKGIVLAVILFGGCLYLWVFPLQSRFVNPIGRTIMMAYVFTFKYFWRTLYMLMLHLLPLVLVLVTWKSMGVLLLFGFSIPIYMSAMAYDKVFAKWEEEILANGQEQDENVIEMQE